MRPKIRLLLVAALALVLAVPASAAIASATSTPDRTTTTTATAQSRPVPAPLTNKAHQATLLGASSTGDAVPAASAPPSCWTQFAPTNPDGIAMAQYYRNCNGYALYVFPGYTDSAGTVWATSSQCYLMSDGAYIFWYYSGTVRNVNYGTYVC
jgi:hypothetical protein